MPTEKLAAFPEYFVAGAFLLLLPPICLALYRFKDGATRFLIAAIWLRYLMSAFHQYTFPPIFAGLSLNALGSVVVTALGLIIVEKRLLSLKALAGIYLVILVLTISAIVNARIDAISSLTKWIYLLVLTIAAYDALRRHGPALLFPPLLAVFLAPLTLQALSIALGVSKGSGLGASFVGTFDHEATLSIILLTFLYLACFLEPERPRLVVLCMVAAVTGLFFANYRTSLLAALPPLAAAMLFGTLRRFSPSHRPLVAIILILTGMVLFYFVGIAAQEQFNDLLVLLSRGPELLKPPQYYTDEEDDLLSARVHIWSQYIAAYLNGNITNYFFGFGPDSWSDVFSVYAHNSLVSMLYEGGMFGFVAMTILFFGNFSLAMKGDTSYRPSVLAAHVGFFLLNMATMPFWIIEGNILFALILGFTVHAQIRRRFRDPQAEPESAERLLALRG